MIIAAGILIVLLAALWTAPRWFVPRFAAHSHGCLYSVPTREQAIAITFDDGPDGDSTRAILEVLRDNQSRATFFLIGEHVKGEEALVAEIVAQGHEIGNHMARNEPSIRLSASVFERDAIETGKLLGAFAPVRWLRPGSAWYDGAMLATIERLGYRCALGSVYPYDPHLRSATLASAYILANIRPGAVIVLHERGVRGPRTVETLKRVLPGIRARGYRVVTLSELDSFRLTPAS